MRPWSQSVMTQRIRLRQRALSSTAPEKVIRTNSGQTLSTDGDSPAMKSALTAIANMKKDDCP